MPVILRVLPAAKQYAGVAIPRSPRSYHGSQPRLSGFVFPLRSLPWVFVLSGRAPVTQLPIFLFSGFQTLPHRAWSLQPGQGRIFLVGDMKRLSETMKRDGAHPQGKDGVKMFFEKTQEVYDSKQALPKRVFRSRPESPSPLLVRTAPTVVRR